jgi:hypothetical protein
MSRPAKFQAHARSLVEHVDRRPRELVRTTKQRRGQKPAMARVPSHGRAVYWYWED